MQGVMKSIFFAVLMAMLGAALAVSPAVAQTGSRALVDVPFDFSLGTAALKAGTYTVSQQQPGVLLFSSKDDQARRFVLTIQGDSTNRSQQPHLVFTRYGSETFLDRVFLSADDDYSDLPLSKREKELNREQARGTELSVLIQPVR